MRNASFGRLGLAIAMMLSITVASKADLINEFEPNPAGGDPAQQFVELSGTAGASFDLWILSIENDGFNGLVDRFSNVTGTYDANGLASVIIDDLENPSNTLILTDSFTGDNSTDIDPGDDGTLDLTALGTIMDAVGVSDAFADDATLYGELLGGNNILFNGEFEPLNVFRDSIDGNWYQTVTVDFGLPEERIAVFGESGGPEINQANFTFDPTTPTPGAVNPGFSAVPEPASAAVALLGICGLAIVRRRQS